MFNACEASTLEALNNLENNELLAEDPERMSKTLVSKVNASRSSELSNSPLSTANYIKVTANERVKQENT